MPNYYENIQKDLRNRSTELWVMSQDTDYYEAPNWHEEPNAYHESPLARKERQKQQKADDQLRNHVAAMEKEKEKKDQLRNHVAAMEKEKEKNLKILATWVKSIHNTKAAPVNQKGKQVQAAKEKQKKGVVSSEKSKVVKKVDKMKDLKKREKQLAGGVQYLVRAAGDTAKTRDQHHRELAGIPKPVVVKRERQGKEQKDEGKNKGRDEDDDDDDDDFLTPEEEVEYLTVASMALVASTQNQMLMMASMDDDWVDDLALVVALQFAGVLDR